MKPTFLRAFFIWLMLMAAESVHGVVRTLWLAPLVGDFRARQMGAIIGSAILFGLTCGFIGWIGAKDKRTLWTVGLVWLFLTLAFELSLGRAVFHYSWQRILEDYDLGNGGLLVIGLAFMAASPALARAAIRHRGSH